MRKDCRSLLLAVTLLAGACSKPRAFAPSDDFARRHGCAAGDVQTLEESGDRVRVTGCGASEVYVRQCENRSASAGPPVREPRQPLTESEVRLSPNAYSAAPGQIGCAWSREATPEDPVASALGR